MPTVKELSIQLEAMQRACRPQVNIVAVQASTRSGQFGRSQNGIGWWGIDFGAQVALANRPGELGRVAGRLGEANININYAYSGKELGTNAPLLFFGVEDVNRAAQLLDQVVSAAVGR